MSRIKIKNAIKKYGENIVINNVNLEIKDGEFFTLLGPSGCGKTTLLRMIAGFNSIEGGDFYFNDERINDKNPSKRNIGMVFQNYAVFPNMTVRENIEFGLKERKVSRNDINDKVDKILDLMQLKEFEKRKPQALSGGQQQRVALARAIVIEPDVLLMDEPLSNLDAKLRIELRETIRKIQKKVGITTVYVTHDQEEAMAVSDTIAVMNKGNIEQCASAVKIYHRPSNMFVASFIGTNNILEGMYDKEKEEVILNSGYKFSKKLNVDKNMEVKVSVRPEDFVVYNENSNNRIKAKVNDNIFLGANTHLHVTDEKDENIEILRQSHYSQIVNIGEEIYLEINKDKVNVFDKDGKVNLAGE
ncbi:MAG: ABC transporter ATP-binding protein [Peptoniphilaceae bacterium]|nr:ABC transporter ATP-binding protein [Peptoniphilaceae bacterium]MDD7383640.1 ABC transporter ATP-binding protein [Peptoniphilaceae bacterium]MDY3737811.1 ABC transporter ATP-binding protein [Peptoniphilaceae bacterium]